MNVSRVGFHMAGNSEECVVFSSLSDLNNNEMMNSFVCKYVTMTVQDPLRWVVRSFTKLVTLSSFFIICPRSLSQSKLAKATTIDPGIS